MKMKHEAITNAFLELTKELSMTEKKGFSGVGLVLYENMSTLSQYHCDLVDDDKKIPQLKVGSRDLVAYLNEITDYQHPYHDGFHFINSEGFLTHVAQFFSPPVNKQVKNIQGQGARTYCAQCGSFIDGVLMVGSVSSKKYTHLFEKGLIYAYSDIDCISSR
jgi:hypothetical protein